MSFQEIEIPLLRVDVCVYVCVFATAMYEPRMLILSQWFYIVWLQIKQKINSIMHFDRRYKTVKSIRRQSWTSMKKKYPHNLPFVLISKLLAHNLINLVFVVSFVVESDAIEAFLEAITIEKNTSIVNIGTFACSTKICVCVSILNVQFFFFCS